MATIKSYTDLSQSRKLAKILPLESADMVYTITNGYHTPWIRIEKIDELDKDDVCAWSLAALLNVLPKKCYPIKDHETNLILGKPKDKWCLLYWDATGMQDGEQTLKDNPIDACYEMIIRLSKLKML